MIAPLSKRIADAVSAWIDWIAKEENIDVVHAANVVLAKVQGKLGTKHRQRVRVIHGEFLVCHYYTKDGKTTRYFCDSPHVYVTDKKLRIGCITLDQEALLEIIRLMAEQARKTEPTVAQVGYMSEDE